MEPVMNKAQHDAVLEVFNVGVARAAGTLNAMVKHHVQLRVPEVIFLQCSSLKEHLFDDKDSVSSVVTMAFEGDVEGGISLLFPPKSAAVLVNTLTGSEMTGGEMDALRMGTLMEVANIIMNSVVGSLCNALNLSLTFALPNYIEGTDNELMEIARCNCDTALIANTVVDIDALQVQGTIVTYFNDEVFAKLISSTSEAFGRE